MFAVFFVSAIALSLLQLTATEVASDTECGDLSTTGRTLNLSINTKRNQTGEWVTTFSARRDSSDTPSDINVDVTHKFTKCEGRQVVIIRGVIKDMPEEEHKDPLLFHPNCGTNALISNNGRTVEKKNLDEGFHGVAITNRPLKINELFEVRLDQKNTKFSDSIGIGLTTLSPEKLEIPRHMNSLKSGFWMMYITNVYHNGAVIKNNYMKNLNELKVGDRIGVKRRDNGVLHMFINGVDQGPAASNIPEKVYGVFELYYNAAKVTIIGGN